MKNRISKLMVSALLVLSMLSNMTTLIQAVEPTNTDSDAGTVEETNIEVPKASEVEHVHNSVGWECNLVCNTPEHVHTLEECYVKVDDLTCEYHDHSVDCYADGVLTCGKKSMVSHIHTIEDCYNLICSQDEGEDHTHTIEDCYEFICTQEESEGHEHSDLCYYVLQCDVQEHTHSESCDREYNCTTEYVLLTVEYYITVNGQNVRAASTFQALLTNGDEYSAPINDLRPDGYKIDTVKRYIAGNEDAPETLTVTEENGKYTVSGKIEKDSKIIVNYVYEKEYAPYRIDYWGYNVAGQDKVLLYSYVGMGKKDSQISVSQDTIDTETISISINDLMKNLYDILGDKDQLGDDSGATFIKNLIQAVNNKYLTGTEADNKTLYHDITPLLEKIAGVEKEDTATVRNEKLNKLTRKQIKQYVAEKIVKVYGFDQDSQQIWDAKLTVTADELAVRNLYYVPKKPQTVLFMTGIPNAEVIGIPQTPIPSVPDADGVELKFDIKLSKNFITTLPTVDISGYTENVYAKHQSYVFVGWVTGEDAQVITDYTPANAAGKYKDITIYVADGDPSDLHKPNIPSGVTTKPLAAELQKMPDGGANYYGVWQPYAASYTVQLWFESELGDNTYVESHTHDIQRYHGIGMPVTFNEFDVERAEEKKVVDAANLASSAIFDTSVRFEDPDSDTIDVYNSYTDYKNSPFYGFDFLECPVCKENPSNCGKTNCTCGKQRKTNADGSEGAVTSARACNYQNVTVKEDGTTVLNLYYTREMWEIAINPNVQLWTTNCLVRPTEFNIYTYWTGGGQKNDIKAALEANKDNYTVISGKYGTKVAAEYQSGIGWDKLGSFWQNEIGTANQTRVIPAETEILLANGSAAFFDASDADGDGYADNDGFYIYPQDTLKYINAAAGTIPDPADWSLPFHGLSKIEPEMFTSHTGRHEDRDDLSSPYITIQNRVSMWEDQRFGEESSYNILDETITYGTHRLNIYPYYHSVSDDSSSIDEHEFHINYYLQALPHEAGATPYVFKTANKDEIKFVKDLKDGEDYSVTLKTPASLLFYSADTPDGFIPLMWRASPLGFDGIGTAAFNRGGFQGKGVISAAYRYTRPQIVVTGANKYQVPSAYATIVYKLNPTLGDHNASFSSNNYKKLNGNSVYLSDWRQLYTEGRYTQDAASVANLDPGAYWITDWIRTDSSKATPGYWSGRYWIDGNWGKGTSLDGSLSGQKGLYALLTKANQGDADARMLLDQLESSFSAGAFYPAGDSEVIYYHTQNANGYRYAKAGAFRLAQELTNSENAIAFARKQYSITYNTCFLDENGEILRDENGIIMVPIHETKYETDETGVITGNDDMVYYDQPLGYDPEKTPEIANFDDFYNNYYDAYFVYNGVDLPTDSNAFTFVGYGNSPEVNNKEGLGGYGKWYLDPDGTIPFNEENMKKMPAGNVDVYFRYNDFRYSIYFVDEEVTGKDKDPMDVVINGADTTLKGVINHQTILPNTTAESFDDPSDANLYFAGWFYDEVGTQPYDFNMEINEDTVVYAVWKPKVPTEYQIRHVLVDADGKEIREIIKPEWIDSYIGNTIDANALDSEYYVDGMYFKVDDYSQSMVLDADKNKNILTFYYVYAGLRYTIEYKDIHSKVDVLPPENFATKLSQATIGMTEIPGWDYQGYSVDGGKLVPQKRYATITVTENGVVVTFWYERIPADDEVMAMKAIDGVLCNGTWFNFELVDENGTVVGTAQSIDGLIRFDSLGLDKVGIYRYTIREVNESDKYRFDYDDTVYEVVLEITQPDITKPLECTITYYKDGKKLETEDGLPLFNNSRISVEVKLEAEKYVNDQLMTGNDFEFLLRGGKGILECGYHVHDKGCYNLQLICDQEEGNGTAKTGHIHSDMCYEEILICSEEESAQHTKHEQSCYSAPTTSVDDQPAINGKIEFNSLEFSELGTYIYTIHEFNDGNSLYQYDESVYRVAVEVFINDRNELDTKLTITCDDEEVNKVIFNNYTETIPSDPGTNEPAANTGDNSKQAMWLFLMGLSIIGVILTESKRRYNIKQSDNKR